MKPATRHSVSMFVVPTALGLGALASSHCARAEDYTATPLGSLGGTASHAAAVNNVGQVVGSATTAGGLYHAFLYVNGSMTDLGTLPGGANSGAEDINLRGQVVGESEFGPDSTLHATRWYGASAIDIGQLAGRWSTAHAINDDGVIVGTLSSGDTYPVAGRWDGSTVTNLAMPHTSFSHALGINESGQVVGQQTAAESYAYLWNGTVATLLPNTGSDSISDAVAINRSGQIAGWARALSSPDNGIHAILWSGNGAPRVATDLGTLGGLHSVALGVNGAAQVVGYAETPGRVRHAALWSDGKVLDLNTALSAADATYLTLAVASAINDHGWIVVDAEDSRTGRMSGAYLLTPAPGHCRRDHGGPGAHRGNRGDSEAHSRDAAGGHDGAPEAEAGMTREDVRRSAWGAPLSVNLALHDATTSELWWYHGGRFVLFTDGCVKSVHR